MEPVRDILSEEDPNDVPCRAERYELVKQIKDRMTEWLEALDEREKGPSVTETAKLVRELDSLTEKLRRWGF